MNCFGHWTYLVLISPPSYENCTSEVISYLKGKLIILKHQEYVLQFLKKYIKHELHLVISSQLYKPNIIFADVNRATEIQGRIKARPWKSHSLEWYRL